MIKKYGCAKIKTTHMVPEMANSNRCSMLEVMMTTPFSVATDASNDDGKLYPLVTRTVRAGAVTTNLLSIIEVNGKKKHWAEHCKCHL